MRWDEGVLDRLQRRARLAGWSASTLAQRLVDESLRMAEHQALSATADQLGLDTGRVSVAARYYGDYSAEIDLLIKDNERAADEAHAAWLSRQQLLQ